MTGWHGVGWACGAAAAARVCVAGHVRPSRRPRLQTETAQQVYDHIDQHIRRLDKELKAFDAGGRSVGGGGGECCGRRAVLWKGSTNRRRPPRAPPSSPTNAHAEIAVERSKLGLPPVEGAPAEADAKRGKKDAAVAAAPPPLTSEELYRAALAAADASEPTYCTCKRISFGEMIACDNPECAVEWFHFECVGLTPETRPKGKWYCKDCRKLLGKK